MLDLVHRRWETGARSAIPHQTCNDRALSRTSINLLPISRDEPIYTVSVCQGYMKGVGESLVKVVWPRANIYVLPPKGHVPDQGSSCGQGRIY